MRILGLDFESTGIDPAKDRITECGAVLWDWEKKIPLQLYSEFVNPEMPIPEEVTDITGITDSMVEEFGLPEREVMTDIECMLSTADYVMAHFGNQFDKLFFDQAYERHGWDKNGAFWLDSSIDVVFPKRITTRNLKHLAAEHGFLAFPSHRAVFDVLTMLNIASAYDLSAIIARAQEPTLFVQALVSFEEKDLAKERGYRWCAPKKIWWRSWKSSDLEADKFECPFRTQILNGAPE